MVKCYYRGYSIKKPTNLKNDDTCYIKNIFHEYSPDPNGPINSDKIYDINKLEEIINELISNPIVIKNLSKNYIPKLELPITKEYIYETMVKIGETYAGINKYKFLNNYDFDTFIEDIKPLLIFTGMPFLC